MSAQMGVFERLHKTTKRRLVLSLYVLSVGIPAVYLLIPAIGRYYQENHKLPFNLVGFDRVVGEIQSGVLKPDGKGRIVLPPDQAHLTNDGCVYITEGENGRLIFFPTEPWDWTLPSAHFYTGYVFSENESLDGQNVSLCCPEDTPIDPFELNKYKKPHWYHASLVD